MPFRFIEHTADAAAEITGKSITGIFLSAFDAWKETVAGKEKSHAVEKKEIELSAPSYEVLLVEFLSELNYLLFTKKWLCVKIPILDIITGDDGLKLIASLEGGAIDPTSIKIEIKAVTFHNLEIVKEGDIYKTVIVFDI
ncbi:archease [Melioribacter sp. Ez-97]|uniref:archease n=1 Tax=Melioribacter sp. Ez-97 TaxID=3423434 RepID=UPI003EDA8F8F